MRLKRPMLRLARQYVTYAAWTTKTKLYGVGRTCRPQIRESYDRPQVIGFVEIISTSRQDSPNFV